MSAYNIRGYLPKQIFKVLWGDRDEWGLVIDESDTCWQEWSRVISSFYFQNQRAGIGRFVNEAGYKVVSNMCFAGKVVLEVGPGDIQHQKFWAHEPASFIAVDTQEKMLCNSKKSLMDHNFDSRFILMKDKGILPVADCSVDVVLSFFSLEHIYPLSPFIREVKRCLKPGGVFAGAVPTEGGLAWGLGRYLTSRRWFKKKTSINPDKIICWEHPNFYDEIISNLEQYLQRSELNLWPLPSLPHIDTNLVAKFIYKKAT